MAITPQTDIRLLKTPIELDNKNQLTFASLNAQTTYFLSLPHLEEDNCTYQRKDNVIRFPAHIDDIINYNYVMYKNENYSNKWFYAFITNMEYVNDNLTLIHIETDVFQTWQFNLTYKKCFVEREHVSDDTIGLHTIPEGLETGEYIIDGVDHDDLFNDLLYVLQTTRKENGDEIFATNFGGIYITGGAYLFRDINSFINIIRAITGQYSDAIIGAYVIPKSMINNNIGESVSYAYFNGQNNPKEVTEIFNKPTTLDGYTPKNNKLLTWPYCFVNVSNNNGSSNSLRYELFHSNNNQYSFKIKGVPVPRRFYKMPSYKLWK